MNRHLLMLCMLVLCLAAMMPASLLAEDSTQIKQTTSAVVARVNINTADAAALESLPGIGPSRAKAIIDLRQRNGGFHSINDLVKVKGIGRKTVKELQPLVSFDAPATKSK